MQLTLAQKMKLHDVAVNFNALLTLDAVATNYLAGPPATAPEDLAALSALSNNIEKAFAQAARDAQALASLVDSDPSGFNDLVSAQLGNVQADPGQVVAFRQFAEQAGGFAELTKQTMATVVSLAPTESATIKRKLAERAAGGNPPGDMSKRAECGIIFGAAILLICTGVPQFAAVGLGSFIARGCISQ